MLLRGQGEIHLKLAVERLKSRFNVEVDAARPQTGYKERMAGHREDADGRRSGRPVEKALAADQRGIGNGQAGHQQDAGQRNDKPRHPGKDGSRLPQRHDRSEEHTSELQSLMRISYAVFCLQKKKKTKHKATTTRL